MTARYVDAPGKTRVTGGKNLKQSQSYPAGPGPLRCQWLCMCASLSMCVFTLTTMNVANKYSECGMLTTPKELPGCPDLKRFCILNGFKPNNTCQKFSRPIQL